MSQWCSGWKHNQHIIRELLFCWQYGCLSTFLYAYNQYKVVICLNVWKYYCNICGNGLAMLGSLAIVLFTLLNSHLINWNLDWAFFNPLHAMGDYSSWDMLNSIFINKQKLQNIIHVSMSSRWTDFGNLLHSNSQESVYFPFR